MGDQSPNVIIVGAGIGGLASALRLAHAGCAVTVLDMHDTPGGKMRTVPSEAGPVDAGPTVLTMRPVFEALFADVGEELGDHITLTPLETLARHYWDDGTRLDLSANLETSRDNVARAFGAKAAREFTNFSNRAKRLFDAFDSPMMQTQAPDQSAVTRQVMRNPKLIWDMAPHKSLAGLLKSSFGEPRLAQLFGRYATYVGGSPYASPAILALIWQAEAQGVWTVEGGMHRLAATIASRAKAHGAEIRSNIHVTRITRQNGKITGVQTIDRHYPADVVLFNGDPRALAKGLLGPVPQEAVGPASTEPRSLSAFVHAFAAIPQGAELAHHTVFFARDPQAEFGALARDEMPTDATLYLCAQDHGQVAPDAMQRFEIIMNGPPVPRDPQKEKPPCQTQIFNRFQDFGLSFSPTPGPEALTTPDGFNALFPASLGSLYGRSPHGLTAAFKRPTARTAVPGLYLCGGGTHPGAGVPMATLSARHAAAAIMSDHASTLTSRQTATRGGTSTGSAIAGPKRSLSSGL
ncbi:1-hydroxycarotenoid 3,4-desaturase CrtD [Yoonia sediminilitoris]|uniref:1-hydroxycarotenoid 3,4-desaturase n=1 Tax=Yoonia sediminilitoris TaxID=1286148 RepID=A0A2T6K8N8_9RHOB|nr:1-hydroxycarotenoid 3,4-desaturase CrtD [Yoonia sediminilitoris]PUB11069.1 1-hydroxycarotenoid 3,4-desaturase [Yoonia sediminilitoris]RCW90988.1 1-hydroxycarotenoid 3,4-desaturase [Yoonia sediminilitoris]